MSAKNELAGLGYSDDFLEKIDRSARESQARQAAEDENAAAIKANALGLTGQDADDFKQKFVAARQEGRLAVRQHVRAVLESPEGKARPSAALSVAMRPELTTEQAIAELAAMPPEQDETEAAANFILGAGR